MLMLLPITAMRLDDHDVPALQGTTTDPAETIIQTLDATAHEGTQQHTGMLIKRGPQQRGHGQHNMAKMRPSWSIWLT